MRLLLLATLAASSMACADDGDDEGGDGDADADVDADGDADEICSLPDERGRIELDLLVDGRRVTDCAEWRLRITACAAPEFPVCEHGTCNRCASGEIPEDCDLGDACGEPSFTVATAGDYTICVTAELPNGGLSFTTCAEEPVTVTANGNPSALELDVVTEDQFPCIRNWYYDGDLCCDTEGQGFCVPPGT